MRVLYPTLSHKTTANFSAAQSQGKSRQILLGDARTREEGDQRRGKGATRMGEVADREAIRDVVEDSGSDGDQVQATS